MGLFEDIFTAAFNGEEPPPIPSWIKWKHISQGVSHCPVCLKLDKCWFTDDKKPLLPQHPHCHCTVEPIPLSRVMDEAMSECQFIKFNPYLFDPEGKYNHGKGAMFKSWGYSIMDSEYLRKEFGRQGLEKYIAGQYMLGKLNKDGQRISIRVELPRKDKEEIVSFITGWMVEPNGNIRLITPYGGK